MTPVVGLGPGSGVVAIAAGQGHTCAVKSDQSVYCWGDNQYGQLGDGTTINRTVAAAVRTLGMGSGVVAVSVGRAHTCVTRNDGAVLCWGGNGFGQLGDGTYNARLTPGYVLGSENSAVRVSARLVHSCAGTTHGVACWGNNVGGQIGDGTFTDRPFPTWASTLDTSVDEIAAGYMHSCARKVTGMIVCWGQNNAGQLGNGSDSTATTPQVVLINEVVFSDGFE